MSTVARALGQLATIAGVAWVMKDLMQNDGEIKSLWYSFMVRPYIVEHSDGRLSEKQMLHLDI